MPAIAAIALIAAIVIIGLIVVSVLGFALHFLFSPWLLVAIAIVAWITFRPRRARQYPRCPAPLCPATPDGRRAAPFPIDIASWPVVRGATPRIRWNRLAVPGPGRPAR
jgi:hypothetical protein